MKKSVLALLLVLAGAVWGRTNLVNSVKVETKNEDKGECTVVLRGNFSITQYQERSIKNPPKLVLDVHGAFNRLKKKVQVESDIVRQIRTSQFNNRPPTVRIVLDLKKPVTYEIKKDKALYIVLRDEALLAAAREESLNTAAAAAESVRLADSLHQAAVAESVRLANAGFITGLKNKGLLLPVGGGAGAALILLVIILIVLGKRKKQKEEAEFENLMSSDAGREPPAGGIPAGDEETAADGGMESKLDEIQSELEQVREQAAQIEQGGGFEVDLVGTEDGDTGAESAADSPAEEPVPAAEAEEKDQFDIDDFQKKFSGAVPDGDEGAKDIDSQIREIEGNKEGDAAPGAADEGDAGGSDDDFDLDATIAELKEKIGGAADSAAAPETPAEEPAPETPAEKPAPEPEAPAEPAAAPEAGDSEKADELDALLDTLGDTSAQADETPAAEPDISDTIEESFVTSEETESVPEPAAAADEDFLASLEAETVPEPEPATEEPVAAEPSGTDDMVIPDEPVTAEAPAAPEPVEPEAAPEPAAPAPEPVTPAEVIRQQEEARRMEEKFRKYEEEENALSARMQAYQQKIDGLKDLLAAREKRLEELIDFNDRIHEDIQNIQGQLDTSLSKLDQAREVTEAPAVPEAPAEPAAPDAPAAPGSFDVVVDDASGFDVTAEPEEEAVADAPAEEPADEILPEPDFAAEPEVSIPEPEPEISIPEPAVPAPEPEPVIPVPEPEPPAPEPAAPAPAPEPKQDDAGEPKFKKVFNLADQGLDSVAIAQQLGMGRGQVELFLKLREKGKMG